MVCRWKRALARGRETSGILFWTMQSQSDNLCRAEKNNEDGIQRKRRPSAAAHAGKNERDGESGGGMNRGRRAVKWVSETRSASVFLSVCLYLSLTFVSFLLCLSSVSFSLSLCISISFYLSASLSLVCLFL